MLSMEDDPIEEVCDDKRSAVAENTATAHKAPNNVQKGDGSTCPAASESPTQMYKDSSSTKKSKKTRSSGKGARQN